jgi:DNA replication protein DnaC
MQPLSSFVPGARNALAPASEEIKPQSRFYTAQNYPTLNQLDPNHHPLVKEAMKAALVWFKRKTQEGVDNASLVLVATKINNSTIATGYGCGKTHLAKVCLYSRHIETPAGHIIPDGYFFNANDLIQKLDSDTPISSELPLKSSWDADQKKTVSRPVSCIVLDDVGTEQAIPYLREGQQTAELQARYFKIINYCYEHGVSVIVTSNLSILDLARHVGGRAWSRLMFMAPQGQMIDMTGVPDYRQKLGGR